MFGMTRFCFQRIVRQDMRAAFRLLILFIISLEGT